uniref:Uncharacterized protein n=1 Tax=Candidatus Kentrum eta TaxID=2126337 RepID=A0A450UTS6_9GAMM|nr:MAG: hypothetical protein BECKH772B_GA0070898_100842 [Candidatus Kentron sp. H]
MAFASEANGTAICQGLFSIRGFSRLRNRGVAESGYMRGKIISERPMFRARTGFTNGACAAAAARAATCGLTQGRKADPGGGASSLIVPILNESARPSRNT